MRQARPLLVLATVVAATLALSGCNVLAPTRNSDGTIITATAMPSTDAWVGDCFTFIDNSNFAYATVVPCTEAHDYVVIGKGVLSDARLARFESLQLAVIALCQSTFDAYAKDLDPEPEPKYIAARDTKPDGTEMTNYSCLATD
jgi:hypothetical protein